ncbi:uncharacterized protein LOC135154166 [Lytechinus pictus]|uniref:uncharacterized protein LOC135154166 n=1 Tax=Lytechinus pictus TaxID=7653 RepID=UPI0030B9C16E
MGLDIKKDCPKNLDIERVEPIHSSPDGGNAEQKASIYRTVNRELDTFELVRQETSSDNVFSLSLKSMGKGKPLSRRAWWIDDTLDSSSGAKWFSTLDLSSVYWQVQLDEQAELKSAFMASGGLCHVMPFGLCNPPATFEQLMDRVLSGLTWKMLLVYLENIIVYGETVKEELARLRIVFQRLSESGLKLKPSKCHLFRTSVVYLGHVVSADGDTTDPKKTAAIRSWPNPRLLKRSEALLECPILSTLCEGIRNGGKTITSIDGEEPKYLRGQFARWMEVIAEYDFDIQYRQGQSHANADGLSRKPCSQCSREDEGCVGQIMAT